MREPNFVDEERVAADSLESPHRAVTPGMTAVAFLNDSLK
jgi:hypothetical protein